MNKKLEFSVFLIIILFAFFLRTYNVNWDAGSHIHPDERFLTMVTNDMRIPLSLGDYLNPQVSTMNPHNINYGFFVYGTFPLYLVKFLAIFLKMDNYGDITILGRYVSAFFDTGVVIILYFLTKLLLNSKFEIRNSKKIPNSKIQKNNHNNLTIQQFNNRFSWTPLLPPFLYSIMVLPIQLSHFFATDTFLVFFMIASFYISVLIRQKIIERKSWNKIFYLSILLGITIGLGLASKITMIFIIPLNFLVIFISVFRRDRLLCLSLLGTTQRSSPTIIKNRMREHVVCLIRVFLYSCIPIFVSSYFFFRMAMPMAFADSNFLNFSLNPKWIKNISDLQTMSSYSLANTFPPSIQWFTTQPILFPLKNMILWGMGIPMAIICIIALIFSLKNVIPAKAGIQTYLSNLISPISLLTFFTISFFLYQGSQFVKPMRYIYPIYWCFALLGGLFVIKIINRFLVFSVETLHATSLPIKIMITLIALISLISLLVYPLSFLAIYSRPHTRVSASRWMFQNMTPGARVTFEEWDDPLPLLIDGHINEFPGTALPMFWPDSEEKWKKITGIISETDYIVLSSNRVYGSIIRRPDLYPQTKKYYELLFTGKLGFEKIAEFTSRPTIPFLNYELIDDAADETFTVYDHPRVMIFRNVKRLTKEELTQKIYQ